MRKVGVLACFAIVLVVSGVCRAQSNSASLTISATDESGASAPGVKVTVTNAETGLFREGSTNNDGFLSFPVLPPGRYVVKADKVGFNQVEINDVTLHIDDQVALAVKLKVGPVSEKVTVTADQNNINTTDGTVSTTIDRNFVENLPLNGRSFQTLILLSPGTALVPTSDGSSNNGGQFSVNGQRANANSFTVDGVSANLGSNLYQSNLGQINGANPGFTIAGTTQGMVSVDALQEFKIQTSTYAPEFGRQPGGQISLLTRSGTNAFHGSAFDYLRNDVFDANNWFNGYTHIPPLPKGKERQNDFGGTIGGPVLKDKTFFFFSYEGLRLLQPSTQIFEVPSLRLRQEAAPPYRAILDSWPTPQGPESVDQNGNPTGSAPYTLNQSFPTNLDSYSIKVDHTYGTRIHLFGRYTYTSSDSTSVGIPTSFFQKLRSRALTLGTDMNLRPNLENEARLNYGVNVSIPTFEQNIIGGATAFDTSVLYPQPFVKGPDNAGWNLSLPSSFFATNPGPYGKYSQRQINVIDNVSYTISSHQLKWGIDYRRLFPIFSQPLLQPSYTVTSEADLISGTVSMAGDQADLKVHPIYTNFSAYIQDTWRAFPRLTLTYGLRWELNPPPGERDGIQPLNVIGLSNPATATLAPLNSKLYRTTYDNFAPRIGLAYQLRQSSGHETVIRAGFGLFYDLDSEAAALGFSAEPFSNVSTTLTDLSFPVANNIIQVPTVPAPLILPVMGTTYAVDPNLRLPYTLQWNVSVEQGLGQNQSVTVSYVASAGNRLLRSSRLFNFNPLFAWNVSAVQNTASSNYQSLQLQFNRRLSQGLQALASYTYSHSIDNASDGQVLLSTSPAGSGFLNPSIDRGNSGFDLRHAFRAALTYNIPSWNANIISKALLGNWSLDMIGLVQTGLPVDLIGGFYSPNGGINGSFLTLRPDVVAGQPLYIYGAQCAAINLVPRCPGGMGFNPNAFNPVPQDGIGNPLLPPGALNGTLGRNVLRGFGAWQTDFAIHRQFNLTERVNLQFRSEFFNIFNHPNFGAPQGFLCGTSCFGLATSTLNQSYGGLNQLYQIGGPRSIQLALKLMW
jgi:hypothetical protein